MTTRADPGRHRSPAPPVASAPHSARRRGDRRAGGRPAARMAADIAGYLHLESLLASVPAAGEHSTRPFGRRPSRTVATGGVR
jgi:hypothetical protein